MKTWVQRQGECILFGDIAGSSSTSAGGEGKESGDWVGQGLGKWTRFGRTSSCWAGSTCVAGTCDRSGSIKAGITIHGGVTWQAGAAAENDMVENTHSQAAIDVLEGLLVHNETPSDIWNYRE